MAAASDWTLARLFSLKRELLDIRRATSPAREIFNQLTNRELGVVDPDNIVYFRDVYDHLIRVTDELDNYRELVAGTLDIYLTIVNNNLSLIMKRLTGVTVILAGLGAVGGIFGMSEASAAVSGEAQSGFWIVTATAVTIAAASAVVLRRIGWI
jgi:magnesium transporter